MKVALVYDRVNKFGGAERFFKNILDIFPDAPIYTLVSDLKKSNWVNNHKVIPTFFNKIKYLRTRHELLAPLASLAFETHDLSAYDLVISLTSADAKSVITHPHQTHICICLTPTRYLWDEKKHYRQDIKIKVLPQFIFNYFRFVDNLFSNRPDFYIAISKEVQNRILKNYQKNSVVIYPPVDSKFFVRTPQKTSSRKYFLVVSRLVQYKKVDLVIKTFNRLNQKLIVVGEGHDLKKLQNIAHKNISFVGQVTDEQLKKYYQSAKAVIFPQKEDFGLVPLEAQASGTPVIAYKKGGALETIIDGQTGLFFSFQKPSSLSKALKKFSQTKFNYQNCIRNARQFSTQEFKQKLIDFIKQVV